MNIALLISGALRTYQRCLSSIAQRIIAENPQHTFDTYINVWDDTLNYVGFMNEKVEAEFIDLSKIYALKQALNLKKISIETYQNSEIVKWIEANLHGKFQKGLGGMQHNTKNSLLHYHRLDETNKMKFSATGYDASIRCRPDIFMCEKLDLENLEDNTIYMPEVACYGPGHCNDQFYFGKVDAMDKIFDAFNNAENIANMHGTLHPESVVFYQAMWHQIRINKRRIVYQLER